MNSFWDDIESITEEYKVLLHSGNVLDLKKFNMYSITHHSTRIEGSTLTEIETALLLDEGIAAKGKPLDHSLMVEDHFHAIKMTLELAEQKNEITPDLLKTIASSVMKRTGSIVNAAAGSWDSSKGEYRKASVRTQHQYFVAYDKVPDLVDKLCAEINKKIVKVKSTGDILRLAFSAHYDLVQIHPWSDGNGRVSRLLMNYIEHFHQHPLTVVNAEHKQEYIEAILSSREKEDLRFIIDFLAREHYSFLKKEIELYKENLKNPGKSGFSLIF